MDPMLDSPSMTAPTTPPKLDVAALPSQEHLPAVEVSMVEAEEVTGVSFSPELWMQRRHWALEVLRKERVRSVLDIGCGPGALLETLVQPPSTIFEPPILASSSASTSQLPNPIQPELDSASTPELFITRLGALDSSTNVIPSAISILSPPSAESSSAFPPRRPRWEPLTAELWLGGIEKYNSWLEGYEAIVALELIEHLDPNVLSRFGVVTMGTYRPRLLLVSTPNFDFNAKFPRGHDDHDGHGHAKGFIDPTGRTGRVFRHSDHKVEMTSAEFRDWAESAAADWGYEVTISGVGISSKPSYYTGDHKYNPNQPIYASQVAVFRLASGVPMRSPRSVRSSELPFLSKESSRPQKLAGRFTHPATAPSDRRAPVDEVRGLVSAAFQSWEIGEVTLDELWGRSEVAVACGGSKRYFAGCLGGFGGVPPESGVLESDWELYHDKARGIMVRWRKWAGEKVVAAKRKSEWEDGQGKVETPRGDAGGW